MQIPPVLTDFDLKLITPTPRDRVESAGYGVLPRRTGAH